MRISKPLGNLKREVRSRSKLPGFLVLLIASLAAIQFSIHPAATQQPVTVKVFMNAPETVLWQPFIKEFEAKNPDINLEAVAGPTDTNLIEDLYTSAFLLGDSPYDLVYMDIVWVPKFAAAGWLRPLSERVTEAELSDFLAGDLNGGRYRGELYRIPTRSDAGMLYYRKDLLKQAGYPPPETFAELIKISQDLQQQGLADWGYLWQGKQYEGLPAMFTEILAGFGGFWVDPQTLEVGLDQPQAVQAVEFLRSTIENRLSPPGVTTYAEEETRRLFQNGKAVFLRNWPYVYSLASETTIAGKYAIKPMVHASGQRSGACQGGWGLGIAKSSKHPEAAWRVIEFFSSAETQKKYSLANGYAPSRKSLYNDPELVAKYNHFPQLLEVIENSVLRPPIAQYAQASDILQRYLSAALTARMTPQQAMKAAANETRLLLPKRDEG
ncbi:MAG TPA: ABC transporter substrate-binding protein [Cyanobacteria bacterium UBA8803]|nr:ABC transporter substrate-binding protein [Cyanobacteria bacterium UBA9273]HBL57528.1 ABC transporter substrate-binding protein [Cyanobacteria bacterium UBA8803]